MNNFKVGDTVKHLRSGKYYKIIAVPDHKHFLEATGNGFYVYQEAPDKTFWYRDGNEMQDGRFILFLRNGVHASKLACEMLRVAKKLIAELIDLEKTMVTINGAVTIADRLKYEETTAVGYMARDALSRAVYRTEHGDIGLFRYVDLDISEGYAALNRIIDLDNKKDAVDLFDKAIALLEDGL